MATKDRQILSTFPLKTPIHAFGEEMRELAFYEPKAKLPREIEANDQMGEQSLAIVSSLTGIPVPILDTLSLEDGIVAIGVGANIVKKNSEPAESRLRALGIYDDPEESKAEANELEDGSA